MTRKLQTFGVGLTSVVAIAAGTLAGGAVARPLASEALIGSPR